jgi:ppGpp synthetase/RelA/SpoT-type nucleotidyltranferase
MRKLQLGGVTAARVKRMPSIRKKLRRISVGLQSIQDLGGCRVILPTMEQVRRYSEAYCERGQHRLRETDYISTPKAGGYRSLHMMLNYADEKYPEYAGR